MNIDERLEALTARHEALAQSLEITQHMQQENEKNIARLEAQGEEANKRLIDLAALFGFVAGDHQNRLRKLEGEAR
jgi:hypothetical protein